MNHLKSCGFFCCSRPFGCLFKSSISDLHLHLHRRFLPRWCFPLQKPMVMVVLATRLRPEKVVTRRWRKMVALLTVLVLAPGFVGLSPVSPRGTSKLVLSNKAGEVESPPASNKAKDLFVGRRYNATVVKLQEFGAKLKLGVDKPGFLHISKVKPKGEYLANMSDAMALNDVIQVGGWFSGWKLGRIWWLWYIRYHFCPQNPCKNKGLGHLKTRLFKPLNM